MNMSGSDPKRFTIGISIGDPAGIGPEICVKALSHSHIYEKAIPVIYTDRAILEKALELTRKEFALNAISNAGSARGNFGTLDFIDTGFLKGGECKYGEVNAISGEASFQYVVSAIQSALAGETVAIVTGPISKEAINLSGHNFAGHTEILNHYTGVNHSSMLLSAGVLNVIHTTTHVSLKEACALITKERVYKTIRLAGTALMLMGKEKRGIGVAGLNPHSSENGLFGKEEAEAITPAIEQARSEGLNVQGPIPPDTVFVKALGGVYDIVVAMYHDQGHIPVKLSGFGIDPNTGLFTKMKGVNATIGLPIIRTSVDHGTAFDKAGKNEANEGSLVDAINMAVTFAKNRRNVSL